MKHSLLNLILDKLSWTGHRTSFNTEMSEQVLALGPEVHQTYNYNYN